MDSWRLMATDEEVVILAQALLVNVAWVHEVEGHTRKELQLCRRTHCQQDRWLAMSYLGGEDEDSEVALELAYQAQAART